MKVGKGAGGGSWRLQGVDDPGDAALVGDVKATKRKGFESVFVWRQEVDEGGVQRPSRLPGHCHQHAGWGGSHPGPP